MLFSKYIRFLKLVTLEKICFRFLQMQRQKSDNTRTKIIQAASKLFVERGYHDVSIKDVRDLSGISNGSIFHHFGSKDGLALQLYLAERDSYWAHGMNALEAAGNLPEDAIAAAVAAVLEYQTSNPGRHNFMIECASADWMARHAEHVTALNQKFAARFAHWAEPHLKSGRLLPMHPELYAALIFGPAQWLARSWTTKLTELPPTEYRAQLGIMVAKALCSSLKEDG